MPVPPITRSLWSSSRCTRTELQCSIITTRHSPPWRAIHASSLSYPVNYARPRDYNNEQYLEELAEKIAKKLTPFYLSGSQGIDKDIEMVTTLLKDIERDDDLSLREFEDEDDDFPPREFEEEEEKPKGDKTKSAEVEGESEKPKRRGPKPKVLQVEGEGETPKRRGRPRKIREDVGEGEVESEKPKPSVLEGEGEVKLEIKTPKRMGRPPKIREPIAKDASKDEKPRRRRKDPAFGSHVEETEPFPDEALFRQDNPSNIPYLNLPPSTEWKTAFKGVAAARMRPTLRNPHTAMMLAEKFIPEGSKDKIVIEASAGPGLLSRALLNLPRERIKKLIIIEPIGSYFKYVEPLQHIDDRVTVVNLNARDWGTYGKLERMGVLNDVQITDWDHVHPQLHFIMQMGGGVDGEQVASQLLRTIPDRQWLFKFGRTPMNLILTDRMYERFKAPEDTPGKKSDNIRCKVSVMAQAVSHLSEIVPYDTLQPYKQHFHPESWFLPDEKISHTNLDSRKPGNPRVAIEVMALQRPLIKPGDLDFWDYVARKLFVVKATPMDKAITALGPGAHNLLKRLVPPPEGSQEPFDLSKTPRQLNANEWERVVEVFKTWPFRPTNLGIEQMFAKKP